MKGGERLEETLYDIQFVRNPRYYKAYVRTKLRNQKPVTEYRGTIFEEVLEQVIKDIMDDHED